MEKIKEKIAARLRENIGEELGNDIMNALEDKAIDQQIKALVKQDKLKIVDQKNKPVFDQAAIKEELFNIKADLVGAS